MAAFGPLGRSLAALIVAAACAAHCRRGGGGVVDLNGHPADPLASDAIGTVLVFVSTDCPISNRYAPELRRLYQRYSPRGVAFLLVYPTARDTPAMVRDHVREYSLPLQAVLDPFHVLVARAKATTTPEAAVFARGGALVYHGRIDDRQVDFGVTRPEPTRRDVQDAVDAVLEGRAPEEKEATPVGCAISR